VSVRELVVREVSVGVRVVGRGRKEEQIPSRKGRYLSSVGTYTVVDFKPWLILAAHSDYLKPGSEPREFLYSSMFAVNVLLRRVCSIPEMNHSFCALPSCMEAGTAVVLTILMQNQVQGWGLWKLRGQ